MTSVPFIPFEEGEALLGWIGLTDALATALMVAGEDGAGWFAQPELAEYSAWVIDRHGGGAWGVGPAIM